MTRDERLRMYVRALAAELKQVQEYQATGKWHIDCACHECQALEAWQALSWWQRLRAKLAY